jgi:hypothetical protein
VVSQAWKHLERYVAKFLGGERIPRGANFSDSLPDVVASTKPFFKDTDGLIFVECKHSKNQPWIDYIQSIYKGEIVVAGANTSNPLVLFELEDIHLLLDFTYDSDITILDRLVPAYMQSHLSQVQDYILQFQKDKKLQYTILESANILLSNSELPLVVMAKKHSSFRLTYVALNSLYDFYSLQYAKHYRKLQEEIRANSPLSAYGAKRV